MRVKRILAVAAIVVGTAAIVLWVMNLGPHGDPKPSATDWISAVGQAIGAIGTAGALWLGAITFMRQVQEQHRALAAPVTLQVGINASRDNRHTLNLDVGGPLPIYNMELVVLDSQGGQLERYVKYVVAREFHEYVDDALPVHEAYVNFTDGGGMRWGRTSKGKLTELGREPKNFNILETPTIPYEQRNSELQVRMQRHQAERDE